MLWEEMLLLLLINCSQTNYSPLWKSFDKSGPCLKNISVSVIGHFLKSSQLEMYIGLKRDVANRDKSPHLLFLSWKIGCTRQQPLCVSVCVKLYLREQAYLSNKASNRAELSPDGSYSFTWALCKLRQRKHKYTNTFSQEFCFRWRVTPHLVLLLFF